MRTVACGSPEFFIARQSLTSSPLRSAPALALGLSAASDAAAGASEVRGHIAGSSQPLKVVPLHCFGVIGTQARSCW